MSRTYKDQSYRVKVMRAKGKTPHHFACELSAYGGRWVTSVDYVRHEAEWHFDVFYRIFCCGHTQTMTADTARHHFTTIHGADRPLPTFDAMDALPRKMFVFGPWYERVVTREFVTKECTLADLDYSRDWQECRWHLAHWERHASWNITPGREMRKLYFHGPERARSRVALRDAVKDFNANGETESSPLNRQGRGSVKWLAW